MTKDQQISVQIKTINRLRQEIRDLQEAYARVTKRPQFIAHGEVMSVEPNIYDEEERHENCTVQILRNSQTGAVSFGWWENE